MTGVIVSGGNVKDYSYIKKYFDNADMVVCADSGAGHLKKLGIIPDILLGDFDSICSKDYEDFIKAGVQILKFPLEKDMTDTELAVKLAVERGCKKIIILGGLGTRMDHSLANIFLLKKLLDIGIEGIIADEHNEIVLINGRIKLEKENGITISLIPLADKAVGVTTKGLYYPLDNKTIQLGSSWGVSNEFTDDSAEVSLTEGLLLVMKTKD